MSKLKQIKTLINKQINCRNFYYKGGSKFECNKDICSCEREIKIAIIEDRK